MKATPAEVITPLKERLIQLREELAALEDDPDGPDFGHASAKGRLTYAIVATENLIKDLENPHAARHP